MTENRNYGVDALRIVSMMMIVTLHVLGQGGILHSAQRGTGQYAVAWFMEIAAYCSVNCYALISGYVGVKAKFKMSGILYLWFQVVFYAVLIAGVLGIVMPERVPGDAWIKALMPISNPQYWYFTAYFAMSFFIPLMNTVLVSAAKKDLKMAFLGIFFVFSVYPTILQDDRFWLSGGYNVWWLMLLYFAGGYIRLYGVESRIYAFLKKYGICVYGVATFIVWLADILCGSRSIPYFFGGTFKPNLLISFPSVFIVIQAYALLVFFAEWKPSAKVKKYIAFAAPMTFGVYLIHCNIYVYRHVIAGMLGWAMHRHPVVMALAALLAVGIVFTICLLIDWVRIRFFEAVGIRKVCQLVFEIMENKMSTHREEK